MLSEKNLHNYQKLCIRHIIDHPYSGLLIDLGLGKTVCALTAINHLIYRDLEINNALVIAPKRVVSSVWEEEAGKWEHLRHLRFSKIEGTKNMRLMRLRQKADIYLVSRDNIAWLCALYGGRLPFDMVVIDELSSFKSYKSQRFKAMRTARIGFKRVVGLTGTPAPNGLMDLWAQIYLIDRGQSLGKTITTYRRQFFRPGRTNGHIVYDYKPLPGADTQIHNLISDICISLKAEDYLDLPQKYDNYIRLDMPSDLARQYKEFEREKLLALKDSREISVINAAALSNKLLQFSNGAVYDDDKIVHKIHDIKLEALKDIIEDANGQPVLVAWIYRFDRDNIKEYLKSYNVRDILKEQDIRDWNAGKIQVALAHPASAGHGLNLQAGGHIIVWFGQTWSLELYQQFNGRLYRQGQDKPVIVNHLILKGTHDEDVIRALQDKDQTQNNLIESIKAKISNYF